MSVAGSVLATQVAATQQAAALNAVKQTVGLEKKAAEMIEDLVASQTTGSPPGGRGQNVDFSV